MLSWNLIIFYKFYIKVLNETDEFVIVLLQCNIPRNTHCDVKLLFLDFGSSLFLNKFYLGTGVSLDLTLPRRPQKTLESTIILQNLFSDVDVVFTTSRFGNPVLQCGKFRFNKQTRYKGPRGRWVCTKISSGCKAVFATFNDTIISANNQHNHPQI